MATAATHQHRENVCVVCTGHLPVIGSTSFSQWMGDSRLRGSICGNCKQVRLSRHLTGVALPHSRTARFLFLSTHHRNHSRKRRHDFSQNPKRCVKALLTYRSGRQQVDSIVTPPPATARAPDRPPSRVPLLRIALDRAQACATPMRALQERRCPSLLLLARFLWYTVPRARRWSCDVAVARRASSWRRTRSAWQRQHARWPRHTR